MLLPPGIAFPYFHSADPPSHSALTYTGTSSEKAFLNTHSKNPLYPESLQRLTLYLIYLVDFLHNTYLY